MLTKIIDRVYIGDILDAENVLLLNGFDVVINVGTEESEKEFDIIRNNGKIMYYSTGLLEKAAGYLWASWRGTNGEPCQDKILVHCDNGLERAPYVVAYFLMHSQKISIEEAYTLVKKSIPNVVNHSKWAKR